jgi:hypothetical protein
MENITKVMISISAQTIVPQDGIVIYALEIKTSQMA